MAVWGAILSLGSLEGKVEHEHSPEIHVKRHTIHKERSLDVVQALKLSFFLKWDREGNGVGRHKLVGWVYLSLVVKFVFFLPLVITTSFSTKKIRVGLGVEWTTCTIYTIRGLS